MEVIEKYKIKSSKSISQENKENCKMKYFQHKMSIILLILAYFVIDSSAFGKSYEFNAMVSMIPHPQKAYRGGEDAYFLSNQLMIVADGVGSWSDFGVNPAFYSRFLCTKGGELFEQNKTFYKQNLVELIADASNQNTHIGSSTMVVAAISQDKLKTCYIGDSGFVIFRLQNGSYKVFFQFKEQQHGFNFPFQLAMQEYYGDDPYLSVCEEFSIEENDIIVMGSDGLFDNVYVSQMMKLINENKDRDEKLFGVAKTLGEMAIKRGKDTKFESPFSVKAKEEKLDFKGGKLDDTTVILGKIRMTQECIMQQRRQKQQKRQQSMKGSGIQDEQRDDDQQLSTFEIFYGQKDEEEQEGDDDLKNEEIQTNKNEYIIIPQDVLVDESNRIELIQDGYELKDKISVSEGQIKQQSQQEEDNRIVGNVYEGQDVGLGQEQYSQQVDMKQQSQKVKNLKVDMGQDKDKD